MAQITFDITPDDIGMRDGYSCITTNYDGADGGNEHVGMGITPEQALKDWIEHNGEQLEPKELEEVWSENELA